MNVLNETAVVILDCRAASVCLSECMPASPQKKTHPAGHFSWFNVFLVLLVIYLRNCILGQQNSTECSIAFLYLNL